MMDLSDFDVTTAVELVIRYGAEVTPCGSRVTCDPPPTDTDADFLVFLPEYDMQRVSDVVLWLEADRGYALDDNEHYQVLVQSSFASLKRGEVNLLLTASRDWRDRHVRATALCRRLNLSDKSDRIALFQTILYDKICGDER